MKELSDLAATRFNELIESAKELVSKGKGGTEADDLTAQQREKRKIDQRIKVSAIEKAFIPRMGLLLQKPLIYRSILDGRAIGEWHMTVGNPLNPIANIGNLVVKTVDLDVGEGLGIDDFPTEFKFTVTLHHGRPRAKQDIESIFNAGNGAMSFSQLPPPSSATNSHGDTNTARSNSAFNGTSLEDEVGALGNDGGGAIASSSVTNLNTDATAVGGNTATYASQANASAATNAAYGNGGQVNSDDLVKQYASTVSRMWGDGFANSPILADYFTELKTKD